MNFELHSQNSKTFLLCHFHKLQHIILLHANAATVLAITIYKKHIFGYFGIVLKTCYWLINEILNRKRHFIPAVLRLGLSIIFAHSGAIWPIRIAELVALFQLPDQVWSTPRELAVKILLHGNLRKTTGFIYGSNLILGLINSCSNSSNLLVIRFKMFWRRLNFTHGYCTLTTNLRTQLRCVTEFTCQNNSMILFQTFQREIDCGN